MISIKRISLSYISIKMQHLPTLIADLALILVCAGIMTLLFKKLKQPLVLGYIVAGFLASPHMPYTPTVMDVANIQIWAEIGVIFLLFALGLEFSFKKLFKIGGAAIIAAFTIIFFMMLVGIGIGVAFSWKRMDCIFLGGMIAMSSTTIIYKAFDDLGLRKKHFASLVLSILIIEDILAIVMMVILSTLAVSHNFEGSEMLYSIGKLVFFLILWFVVGIYLIPGLLKRCRKLMSEETLLIVSLALCLGMVVLASKAGFSAAFGAFIMGSILAETVEAEKIEHLIQPVKNLFGAIFFVSVGMMVDPLMMWQYIVPIGVLTLVILVGQSTFGTLGVLLAGKPLKTAMQCGFSLTQIGEFAFIIASLGISLKVTSSFLYPIVVAVSVITTFLTPYMIRLADPVTLFVEKHLPVSWDVALKKYAQGGSQTLNHENDWKKLIFAMLRITIIYSILSIAIIFISYKWITPFLRDSIDVFWGALLSASITVILISPFLRAIMIKKNHSNEFVTLWNVSKSNRAPLVATIVIRVLIVVSFIIFVIASTFKASIALIIGIAVIITVVMIGSRGLKRHSILLERKFLQNLRSRDLRDQFLGDKKPDYAGKLLSYDLHLTDIVVPADSVWGGKSLMDLNLAKRYGIHITSILRGNHRINIPGGRTQLFPLDKIQIIGTDDQINKFVDVISKKKITDIDIYENKELILRQLLIDENCVFLGKTIKESHIRDSYHCFIAGIERNNGMLMSIDVDEPFLLGDILWIVGEKDNVYQFVK